MTESTPSEGAPLWQPDASLVLGAKFALQLQYYGCAIPHEGVPYRIQQAL